MEKGKEGERRRIIIREEGKEKEGGEKGKGVEIRREGMQEENGREKGGRDEW